jgi:hypothetical protein
MANYGVQGREAGVSCAPRRRRRRPPARPVVLGEPDRGRHQQDERRERPSGPIQRPGGQEHRHEKGDERQLGGEGHGPQRKQRPDGLRRPRRARGEEGAGHNAGYRVQGDVAHQENERRHTRPPGRGTTDPIEERLDCHAHKGEERQ